MNKLLRATNYKKTVYCNKNNRGKVIVKWESEI